VGAALFPPGVPRSKRLLDLALTVPGFLLVSPLLAILAVLVRVRLGSPVVFRQVRPGLQAQPFTLYKFRTMVEARDSAGHPLADETRLTGLGRFLRSFSLDELPELVNVLRGEMSLVGPRPLLMAYLARYTAEQARRHEVLPGITGWAQVNGRNALTWEQKFEHDVWYVDHWTLWLDLRILATTMLKTLTREGISQPGQDDSVDSHGREGKDIEDADIHIGDLQGDGLGQQPEEISGRPDGDYRIGSKGRDRRDRRRQDINDLVHVIGDHVFLEHELETVGHGLQQSKRTDPVWAEAKLDASGNLALRQRHVGDDPQDRAEDHTYLQQSYEPPKNGHTSCILCPAHGRDSTAANH